MIDDVIIRPSNDSDTIPWDLLLLADPEKSLVESYLKDGFLFLAEYKGKIIGEYVLLAQGSGVIELKNVAVSAAYHGRGLGKKLVLDSIKKAREKKYKTIEVGTGNSGFVQLALYQKCGFRMERIERDFFLHYDGGTPIIENGIRCIDMVILSMDL